MIPMGNEKENKTKNNLLDHYETSSLILEGKTLYAKILKTLKAQISEEFLTPELDIVKIGDNKESEVYVAQKAKAGESIGVKVNVHKLEEQATQAEAEKLIAELNKKASNGIIVQLPVPKHISVPALLSKLDPKKDVDGITPYNLGMLLHDAPFHKPCTPLGVIKLLEYFNIGLEGKNVCIINRSLIVGKPLFFLMLKENATVTLCHSKTIDLEKHTKQADIVVTAIGKPLFFGPEYFTQKSIIIDVGINRTDQGIFGDVDFKRVKDHVKAITPVPGGVGKMTVAMLMHNVVNANKIK